MNASPPSTPAPPPARLTRTLGLWSSVGIVIGITIGSGIFRSPAGVARLVPNPLAMIGLWTAGGLITLCGALSLAELAAALPETGGFYIYLREGWGRWAAFLFGWSQLVLIRASALGGIAIVFGEYLLRSLRIDPVVHVAAARGLSAGAIAFAAAVNIVGVRLGAAIVGVSTVAKFSALVLLVAAALLLGGSHGASAANLTTAAPGSIGVGAMGLALVSILWAYDGFGDLSFASGEVKDPQRNLPRAIILGTLALIVIYVATNVAYLYVSPIETVGRSPLVAADTMLALFGQAGVVLVSVFVMISSFSSLNGSMLASPRIFFAMADDGLFFPAIAKVHPRFRTPYVAILLASMLGMALVLSRSFEALTNTFVLAIWPFYALSVAAIYRLRRERPDLPRPYRVVGYPVVPALFVVSVIAFVANALVNDTLNSLVTFGIIGAGAPVYYFLFSRRSFRAIDRQIR
ncbi:MAG TPA: amino acid permease [Vicinamibacterales bacterium]|jgi:APA family basic amino acid/polyamine antiporter|nr:amino acid permease [Vicinamibacterales bacterium]